ncbi:MAG TPA: toll/interleukin-1 receptor domain-containing protein [Ktedonobacteraceae bacterium]|nr:toll/interleukin-1 receptor domain-containing protein [Ktedonobacteraceae bacterium]
MADSMHAPKWQDINQVRASFGLSDETIAQLTQEDESFKRVKDDIVEYDVNKIYNHPKVRAFMNKQDSGKATGISYEKIIKDNLQKVTLPELNDDQRLYLKTIFDHFHNKGKWPTYLWVENTILHTYPEKRAEFDLVEICKSLPDGFASAFSFNHQYQQEAAFIAPVLYYFPEAAEDIEDFIRVVGFCVEKMNASIEERPEISSEDLSTQLHMQPLAISKIGLLLMSEPDIHDGSGSNASEGWWRVNLRRGKYGVRRFDGVETFKQYLAKRTALTSSYSIGVTAQSVQREQIADILTDGLPAFNSAQNSAQQNFSESVKPSQNKLKIFFCYAHEDEILLKKLKSHLRPLERENLISMWHDRDISAGAKWEEEIMINLDEAQIILLLISPDFMDSDYCYGIEMQRALERHDRKDVEVIPIILRPVSWQGGILGKLQALPTDAKPVMSSKWHNPDEAFFDIAEGIRGKVNRLISNLSLPGYRLPLQVATSEPTEALDPITFKRRDQENDYRSWVATHQNNGLIVVKDGSRWRVHHTYCPYIIGPIDKGQNLMTYPKICSTSLSKLRSEAEKYHATILLTCPSCQQ